VRVFHPFIGALLLCQSLQGVSPCFASSMMCLATAIAAELSRLTDPIFCSVRSNAAVSFAERVTIYQNLLDRHGVLPREG
jgi:hypothetical protein